MKETEREREGERERLNEKERDSVGSPGPEKQQRLLWELLMPVQAHCLFSPFHTGILI